ncbi:MAG: FKBP-type peptidyl-prolyl cis-trans isomerase [bacterium]|nr:FKBP-type peptidyl-prolyl cis-trans isomerase [bacterium]
MFFAPRFSATRVLASSLLFALVTGQAFAADAPKSDDEKAFYAIGTSMARQLETLKPISAREMDLLIDGMKDVVNGEPLAVEQQEGANYVRTLVTARQKVALENEKAAAADFTKREGAKSGAKTTESGLVYTEVKAGSGAQPKATDKVRVHYHGTLRDGSVFDSSVDKGQPAEFPLNRVIPCWTEGVAMMKVGGKSSLVCPASIAYGDKGRPGIPGGAALKFEVELIEIVK